MSELSMHSGVRPEWPLNAVPKRWVESLFSKMAAFYGDKFANMWRGTNIDEVQKAWAIEMQKLSTQQLKAGVDNLTALPKPPTLPEFLNLCRQSRAEQAASALPKLEQAPARADEKTVDANVARMMGIVKSVRLANAHPGWAFDMCLNGKARAGDPVAIDTWAHCRDAILSDVARVYAHDQMGERKAQCVAVLRQVVRDANNGVSKFKPFEFTGGSDEEMD